MDRKIIQISIEELILVSRGPLDSKKDINLFRFSMNQPAEGVPGVETAKIVSIKKEIPTDWSDFDLSLIFKTPLRGKAKLNIEALAIDKLSGLEKFLARVFSAAIGVWTGGFGNAYVGAVTKIGANSLVDALSADATTYLIGSASVLLDSENLSNSVLRTLLVEQEIAKPVGRQKSKTPGVKRKKKVVVPKGPNGSVRLRIDCLA